MSKLLLQQACTPIPTYLPNKLHPYASVLNLFHFFFEGNIDLPRYRLISKEQVELICLSFLKAYLHRLAMLNVVEHEINIAHSSKAKKALQKEWKESIGAGEVRWGISNA